jgi:nucleoside-diphosphate-sugar epimerase
MKLAVLGASGFVGSRLLEQFHLQGTCELRPIVRTVPALARMARFQLDWKVSPTDQQERLAAALQGCDVVVNLTSGDSDFIRDSVTPFYGAARQAGVRRVVFLSSAVVHGQEPAPGTTDDTPLVGGRGMDYNGGYNRAKVEAEERLRQERRKGGPEIVILRPGIVFGPRAHWIQRPAEQLLAGRFAWVNHGQGICNSIYVDNLVEAIRLAATVPGIDGEAFLVGDAETSRWCDMIGPIASALGLSPDDIPNLAPRGPALTLGERLRVAYDQDLVQAVVARVPRRFKQAAKAAVRTWREPPKPGPWELPRPHVPRLSVSRDMEVLYQCAYRLPHDKAVRLLGYRPPVPFAEGLRRCLAWLEFANFPVRCAPSGTQPGTPPPLAHAG